MNVKRIVLVALTLYVIGAGYVMIAGLVFGDPNPGSDSAQSLIELNTLAQNGIADRVNDQTEMKNTTNKETSNSTKIVAAPVQKSTTVATSTSDASSTPTTSTPSTPATSTPTPAPVVKKCGEGGTCTVAEVSAHNTQSNCWVMYGGKAYNVTSYVNAHPGGSRAFDSSTCGTDITAQMQGTASSVSLNKTQNHSSGAYSDLNNYYIADVSS